MNRKQLIDLLVQEYSGLMMPQKKRRSLHSNTSKLQDCLQVARKQYPELKGIHIFLVYSHSLFLMETRPTIGALFGLNKKYCIFISKKNEKKLVSNFSSQALIGLIGHELGHILDFQNRNVRWFISYLIRYAFPKYRKRMELENEIRALFHGFGYQMIQYLDDMEKSAISTNIKKYRHNYYLRKKEIQDLIKNRNNH